MGMTETTTIKIPKQIRDRLHRVAAARHTTMRALLDQWTREAEAQAFFERVHQQMDHMRTFDPDTWADYMTEGFAWEEGTNDPIDA